MSRSHIVLVGSGGHDTATPDVHTASAKYVSRFNGPVGAWFLERQRHAFERLLIEAASDRGGRPLRVLDVGGGHGQVTGILLDHGHEVVVHGSREVCFDRIAPVYADHPGMTGFVTSSLWRLPFADRSFDMVIGIRLLGHVRAWRAMMAEMGRVSDRFLILEFARATDLGDGGLGRLWFRLKQRFEGTTRPFYSYDEEVLRKALTELEFQGRDSDAQYVVPMLLHRFFRSATLSRQAERLLGRAGAGLSWRSPVLLLAERPAGAAEPAAVGGMQGDQATCMAPASVPRGAASRAPCGP